MDWEQIEKDWAAFAAKQNFITPYQAITWFKYRIESELPPEKLTEEEKTEFYTTDLTANVKANYGK